jgi:peptide/nickel transport system substrate-binding protein
MIKLLFSPLAIVALIQFMLGTALSPPSLAQEWHFRRPKGTLRVVDFFLPTASLLQNYAEGLVTVDQDNNYAPCLAEDWRWVDDRTIEFKLRRGVTFHNGEEFNAEAVLVNWEEYKKMKSPRPHPFLVPPDETIFEIIDESTVRVIFPKPDGQVFVKFLWFFLVAPAFFSAHRFDEMNWGYFPEAGPWGTGPFRLVEGSVRFGKPSDRFVLEAYENYWDRRYPKVDRVIFNNTLIGDRDEAMRLCRQNEGAVDIVTRIRPLDTLKVAESPFAKVVKSKDITSLVAWLNQRKRDRKWRDIRLRRAVNYAINREELWKYAAKGNAYNLGGYIPPGAYGHNPALELYTYDTEKARSMLAEAGYPEGFAVKIITSEAWKLETQIISRMLERIGLRVKFEVLTFSEFLGRVYTPHLEKPVEEQDWDIAVFCYYDWYGHTGASFLTFGLLDESNMRWIDYDGFYEDTWRDMAMTVDPTAQEKKIRDIENYIYEHAYILFIYSPLMLYAVNKEVNFVPFKNGLLFFRNTSVTDNHWSIREGNE